MRWHLIHSKPSQEDVALRNLMQQGYECFLPTLAVEKVRQRQVQIFEEPLFPRYLFVRLDHSGEGLSWSPIRSTRGVSQLVRFGSHPAVVADNLIALLQARSQSQKQQPVPLFQPGQRVRITDGTFAGIDAVYSMPDGEGRALVLIEILSKQTRLKIAAGSLRKIG